MVTLGLWMVGFCFVGICAACYGMGYTLSIQYDKEPVDEETLVPEHISVPTEVVPPIEMHTFLAPDTSPIDIIPQVQYSSDTLVEAQVDDTDVYEVIPSAEVISILKEENESLRQALRDQEMVLQKMTKLKTRHYHTIQRLKLQLGESSRGQGSTDKALHA